MKNIFNIKNTFTLKKISQIDLSFKNILNQKYY